MCGSAADDPSMHDAPLRVYALLTAQGTAASETMLCADHVRTEDAVRMVMASADRADFRPGDTRTFEDVTGNDEAVCRWCGRDSRGIVS